MTQTPKRGKHRADDSDSTVLPPDAAARDAAKRDEAGPQDQALTGDGFVFATRGVSDEERAAARLGLQKLPRNANPTRQHNRCAITGRARGTFRQFGIGRSKIREMAFAGDIPGIVKASW